MIYQLTIVDDLEQPCSVISATRRPFKRQYLEIYCMLPMRLILTKANEAYAANSS